MKDENQGTRNTEREQSDFVLKYGSAFRGTLLGKIKFNIAGCGKKIGTEFCESCPVHQTPETFVALSSNPYYATTGEVEAFKVTFNLPSLGKGMQPKGVEAMPIKV